jgi:hypothetical protein
MNRRVPSDGDEDLAGLTVELGTGGIVGAAWMAGLATGQRRGGIGLAGAGLTVGTSAGAIIAALLATGQDLDRLADPSPAGDPGILPRGSTVPASARSSRCSEIPMRAASRRPDRARG